MWSATLPLTLLLPLPLTLTRYVLHWSVEDTDVRMLAEATAADGYVAVGWSRDGMMTGSDSVIGWAGHAAAYRLEGRSVSDVVPDLGDQAVTLADASTEVEDGVLLLRFTRPLAAGRVAVDPLLPITHLWAVGSRAELSNHQVRVRVRVWVRVGEG